MSFLGMASIAQEGQEVHCPQPASGDWLQGQQRLPSPGSFLLLQGQRQLPHWYFCLLVSVHNLRAKEKTSQSWPGPSVLGNRKLVLQGQNTFRSSEESKPTELTSRRSLLPKSFEMKFPLFTVLRATVYCILLVEGWTLKTQDYSRYKGCRPSQQAAGFLCNPSLHWKLRIQAVPRVPETQRACPTQLSSFCLCPWALC